MTEEELNCLKKKCLGLETDLRLVMDERTVLQQMFDEQSGRSRCCSKGWQVNQQFTVPL